MLLIKPRILIVEDDAAVAEHIQLRLQKINFQPVGITTHSAEVITMVEALRPNLVLMDIQLQGVSDGITAAELIRKKFNLPVVFLTALMSEDILHQAKITEPFGYILKPFSDRELLITLEMALYKHQTELKLREQLLHNEAILANMMDGVITINTEGLIESFNLAASTMFGYEEREVLGHNVSMLMPEPDHSRHDIYLQHYHSTGEARILGAPREVEAQRKDGSTFPALLSVSKFTRSGKTTFIGMMHDITQQRANENEIRRLAFFDALTGLPNRRLLTDRLKLAMINSSRTGRHGCVMFLDLDHFKQINDTLGHSVGDELLLQTAKRLQACVREGDSVCRLGGDEFVVLLEHLSLREDEARPQAEAIATKILNALRDTYHLQGHAYMSTPSIGVALFVQNTESIDELLKKADAAMYQAKAAGRNTVRFFDPTV
jgi:diguanylate cyclase (GGDEF)-like protein/PAS domain S-box-containing protein